MSDETKQFLIGAIAVTVILLGMITCSVVRGVGAVGSGLFCMECKANCPDAFEAGEPGDG